MERGSDDRPGRAGTEFDAKIREVLIATYGDVQPPERAWHRIVRRAADFDRAAYTIKRREEAVLVI